MNTTPLNDNGQFENDDSLNLRDELNKYLLHWKWFLLSVFVSFCIAFVYMRIASPIYEISSKLLIKEQKGGGSALSAFQDLGMLDVGGYNNIDNEIAILQSRTVAKTVVEDLNLNISYYQKGRIKESEVYNVSNPLQLQANDRLDLLHKLDTTFHIVIENQNEFLLLDQDKEFSEKKQFQATFVVDSIPMRLSFSPSEPIEKLVGNEYRISIQSFDKAISGLVTSVGISTVDKGSSVLQLSMKHGVVAKANDILNTLVRNYQKLDIMDKSRVEQNTSLFVSERLQIIQEELAAVDKQAEAYKKDNKLTDVAEESKQFFETAGKSEQALFDANTQLKLVQFMESYLEKESRSDYGLIPSLGFSDSGISVLTEQYNKIVLDRNRVLRTSTADNPLVRNYEAQLTNLRNSLDQSLQNLESSLGITLSELNKQDSKFNNKLVSIPRKEREYRDIIRQQGIKESLYLYLLQKQEETQISLAVTTSNSKVIDKAYGSPYPVAPKGKIILLAGLLLGLLIPFAIIYVNDLLDTKFHSRHELEKIVTAPVLGDIPLHASGEHIVVKEGDRSSTSEAFRLIRTNLDFILSDTVSGCKTIFVTSSTSGEGKSFVSVNLASALALSGKKVALVGMDLRAPKLNAYLNVNNKTGVTNYIKNKDLTLEDLKSNLDGHPSLDVFASGAIPPNPAELLLNSRITELFESLHANYDYIVADTAPVNLVTDTLMIAKHADMFVYVARANYLDKRLLEIPQKLYVENRLPKLAMLINGSDPQKAYGYGAYGAYGYGVDTTKKSWLKKIFTS